MSNENKKKTPPSIDTWLREAKRDPEALQEGMYLVHNGTVRQTPKAKVRQGVDDGGEGFEEFGHEAVGGFFEAFHGGVFCCSSDRTAGDRRRAQACAVGAPFLPFEDDEDVAAPRVSS